MATGYCQTERHCEDGNAGVIRSAILVCPANSKLPERAHRGRKANTKSPALIRPACNQSRNNDLQSSAANEHFICYIPQIIIINTPLHTHTQKNHLETTVASLKKASLGFQSIKMQVWGNHLSVLMPCTNQQQFS